MKKRQPLKFRVLDALAQCVYYLREVPLQRLNNYLDRQAGKYWLEE
ncbi:MAG: hypothetical protein AAF960_25565 [Bacteroidota bacterium]